MTAHDFYALTISEVRRETPEAISVAFAVPATLRDLFAYKPGQHLSLRTTIDGTEQRRSYSICSGPDDGELRIAIKRIDGGLFSNWAHGALTSGVSLDVMPPAGRFVLPPSEGLPRHVLFLAAGAGITPIISIIKHALAAEPSIHITLVYGNRTPEAILFREELEDLKDRYLGRLVLLHTLSGHGETGSPLLEGRITEAKIRALASNVLQLERAGHVFLCGPGSMIKEARNTLLALGVARERIHHEFFAPGGGAYRKAASALAPPVPREIDGTAVDGSEVEAIIDGARHRFTVPRGGHVVDAAVAAGVRVPYSCKGGMCCTCRARLVEGSVAMTTNYSLEPWEVAKGFIFTCQAVPQSPHLLLDYDQM